MQNFEYKLTTLFLVGLLAACAENKTEPKLQKAAGQETYEKQCSRCHGIDGTLGMSGAKNLSETNLSAADMIPIITNGSSLGVMPAYKGILSEEEIKNVAEYIETRIKK